MIQAAIKYLFSLSQREMDFKSIIHWLSARWVAIIAPNEVRIDKAIQNVGQVLTISVRAQKERERRVTWAIRRFKELGLSNAEIRAKALRMIEGPDDPRK